MEGCRILLFSTSLGSKQPERGCLLAATIVPCGQSAACASGRNPPMYAVHGFDLLVSMSLLESCIRDRHGSGLRLRARHTHCPRGSTGEFDPFLHHCRVHFRRRLSSTYSHPDAVKPLKGVDCVGDPGCRSSSGDGGTMTTIAKGRNYQRLTN
jgi:hypothetical protein